MARLWIVVDDTTSSGGRVLTGSTVTDIDGKAVARVNDTATCPQHGGEYPIVDGDETIIVDGQPVALHDSKLSCGCTLVAVQQLHVYVDEGAEQAATPAAPITQIPYDEAFILLAEDTGKPLVNRLYKIYREDGSIEEGKTDAKGLTHVVNTDKAEALRVELGEEGPDAEGGS